MKLPRCDIDGVVDVETDFSLCFCFLRQRFADRACSPMSKCYRNPFDIPLDVCPALMKAQRLLDATRIERLLAVCIHQNILPCLSSRQSLIDSSLHIGTPGIAYAFLRLAAASPEVLTNAELDPLVCSSTALQLLAGVQDGANNGEHDPGSLLFGEAGKCLVETLAAEASSKAQSDGILRYLGFQEPRALSDCTQTPAMTPTLRSLAAIAGCPGEQDSCTVCSCCAALSPPRKTTQPQQMQRIQRLMRRRLLELRRRTWLACLWHVSLMTPSMPLLAGCWPLASPTAVVWGPARRSCAATRIRNIVLLKGDGPEPPLHVCCTCFSIKRECNGILTHVCGHEEQEYLGAGYGVLGVVHNLLLARWASMRASEHMHTHTHTHTHTRIHIYAYIFIYLYIGRTWSRAGALLSCRHSTAPSARL